MVHQQGQVVFCAFLSVLSINQDIIFKHIPVTTAVVQGSINTEVIAIHKDHLGLAQFGSIDDDGYSVLTQHLLQMMKQAPSVILKNWEKYSLSLCGGYKWSNNPGIAFVNLAELIKLI